MTTKTGAEGIDLHNVRQVHIIEPYWNPVRLKQVRGRAVRVNSHRKLPKADRTVDIYTYVAEAKEEQLKAEKTRLEKKIQEISDLAQYESSDSDSGSGDEEEGEVDPATPGGSVAPDESGDESGDESDDESGDFEPVEPSQTQLED